MAGGLSFRLTTDGHSDRLIASVGSHQNYFRDFDPAVGRYVESDPIGLKGGINTYGYAFASPIMRIDAFGLAPVGPDDDPVPDQLDLTAMLCKAAHPDSEDAACERRCQCVQEAKIALCHGNTGCMTKQTKIFYACKLRCATASCILSHAIYANIVSWTNSVPGNSP